MRLLVLLFVAFMAWSPFAHASEEGSDQPPVKVLAVFPEELAPSKVYFMTDGEATRGLLLPFAAIANSVNLQKRSNELGAKLDATLAGYDRYEILDEALQASFRQRSPMFALTATSAQSRFLKKGKPNALAFEEGFGYVLVIEDVFSGLSMLNVLATRSDDVAPMATIRYRLYDAEGGKLLSKGIASQNGLEKKHISIAPTDRSLFVDAYPGIARGIAMQLVGSLFRNDVLHGMARSVGRGDEVPQVSTLLKKNESRFSYSFAPANGWKRTKMNTPYANVLEPKGDLRYQLGIRFEVDLLVPEFGQDVSGIDEYIPSMLERLADAGVDTSTFSEFHDIDTPAGYKAYAYAAGTEGGRNILLLRMLDEDLLELVTVVVTKDFETVYPKYRPEIERNISSASLRLKAG